MEYLIIGLCAVTCVVSLITLIIVLLKKNDKQDNSQEIISAVRGEVSSQQSQLRQELTAHTQSSIKNMGDMLVENQRSFSRNQQERLSSLEDRMNAFSRQNDQKLENIRQTVDRQLSENRETMEKRLEAMQNDNNRKLDEMRKTVDERLEKSLEDKMNKSFSLVSQRLEQVYKGLGEMQNLATGVGDLKKVLSNVKTRGILGEIQLGSILSEILSPEQYAEKFAGVRSMLAYMYSHPGKKLLFMGSEFGQFSEWNYKSQLDWNLLDYDMHRKLQAYTRALNNFYKETPALWEIDYSWEGFEWIIPDDNANSVLAYKRKDQNGDVLYCLLNFTKVNREGYKMGCDDGVYEVVFDTDAPEFGGSGWSTGGKVESLDEPMHSQKACIALNIAGNSALFLKKVAEKDRTPKWSPEHSGSFAYPRT